MSGNTVLLQIKYSLKIYLELTGWLMKATLGSLEREIIKKEV
jgi:hypothetical protein